jgi:hypothetical protein
MPSSPILYRFFYLLTPPSELPPLPPSLAPASSHDDSPPERPSYLPIHLYTVLQIVLTTAIFIVTLTRAAPAFPVLIIALVPFRLLVMKRWWRRDVLRFVDAWACREGTPEDEEDERAKRNANSSSPDEAFFVVSPNETDRGQKDMDSGLRSSTAQATGFDPNYDTDLQMPEAVRTTTNNNNSEEWIELDLHEPRPLTDEETGDTNRAG